MKNFLKVRFLAMAEYSSELELCSFGLTKSFPYLFLLFLSALLIACSDKKPEAEQPDSGMARRTVLVYMCVEKSMRAWT